MKLQQVVAIVLLLSMMFNAGLQVNRGELLSVFKNVSLLAKALLANFVVVPFAAFVLVRLFWLDDPIATGILLMAISPGVPFIVLAAGKAKGGSHELATTLGLILPALSFFTIPIMAQLMLPASDRVDVPLGQLMSLLGFQVTPLFIGAVFAAVFPAPAKALIPWLGRLTMIALLALMAILVPSIFRSVIAIFGSRGILAVILIDAISLVTGWLLGGPRNDERFTLAVGTALRNPAMAMVIATTRFSAPAVSASVVVYFLIQFLGATIFGGKGVRRFAEARSRSSSAS